MLRKTGAAEGSTRTSPRRGEGFSWQPEQPVAQIGVPDPGVERRAVERHRQPARAVILVEIVHDDVVEPGLALEVGLGGMLAPAVAADRGAAGGVLQALGHEAREVEILGLEMQRRRRRGRRGLGDGRRPNAGCRRHRSSSVGGGGGEVDLPPARARRTRAAGGRRAAAAAHAGYRGGGGLRTE